MTTRRIPIDKIDADPGQPRKLFDAKALDELAVSIKANGLIQAVIVRPRKSGRYILVAGERRWRAHRLLRDRGDKRFASIKCEVVKSTGVVDTRIKQIVENIARADMTPFEEAEAFADLAKLGLSVEEIARRLGVVEFRVRWRLQLLNLAPEIRKMVEAAQLDRQQALEVARLPHHADQRRMVRMVNRGELVGWKAVRNAVDAILNRTTSEDLFGDAAPAPTREELAALRGMEAKIERVVAMVAGGWKDGECVVAAKVSPDRARLMADKIAAMRRHLTTMERELRNMSAQAKIVLAG